MRYGRLADLVRLAMQMQGRADGMSLDDIGQTFEVSRRTSERMPFFQSSNSGSKL
jgi:hypothetical protein